MKKLDIEIMTNDRGLESDILERMQYSINKFYKISVGEISLNRTPTLKSIGSPDVIDITLKILTGISSAMVAKWIWEKLQGKTIRKIRINRREIQFDKGEITRIIEETSEINE